MNLQDYARAIASEALKLGAIRLSPQKPFKWASGYYMPIYNDNRSLLADWKTRRMISEAFSLMLEDAGFEPENIAGTATAGIAHATTLADRLHKAMSYVRSSSKDHGLGQQIEGLGLSGSYNGCKVLVIEDLISTGLSSINAVKAVVAALGVCPYCFGIFSYGLDASRQAFSELDPKCEMRTILDYDFVLSLALESGYINQSEHGMLSCWRSDPFGWGHAHGFEREEK